MRGLLAESAFIERIPDNPDGEDRNGEAIAAVEGGATGELGDSLVAIFGAGGGVPEGWVEDYGGCCHCLLLLAGT